MPRQFAKSLAGQAVRKLPRYFAKLLDGQTFFQITWAFYKMPVFYFACNTHRCVLVYVCECVCVTAYVCFDNCVDKRVTGCWQVVDYASAGTGAAWPGTISWSGTRRLGNMGASSIGEPAAWRGTFVLPKVHNVQGMMCPVLKVSSALKGIWFKLSHVSVLHMWPDDRR